MFPGCVNDARMSGNTSKLVFGPLALSVMVSLTTPNTDPQWSGGRKKRQVWLLFGPIKKTLLILAAEGGRDLLDKLGQKHY